MDSYVEWLRSLCEPGTSKPGHAWYQLHLPREQGGLSTAHYRHDHLPCQRFNSRTDSHQTAPSPGEPRKEIKQRERPQSEDAIASDGPLVDATPKPTPLTIIFSDKVWRSLFLRNCRTDEFARWIEMQFFYEDDLNYFINMKLIHMPDDVYSKNSKINITCFRS